MVSPQFFGVPSPKLGSAIRDAVKVPFTGLMIVLSLMSGLAGHTILSEERVLRSSSLVGASVGPPSGLFTRHS
jgi:hypothetical protein